MFGSDPGRARRLRLPVAALLLAGCVLGGTDDETLVEPRPEDLVPTSWEDPATRLRELLDRGREPGELEVVERLEVEALVAPLFGAPTGDRPGQRWKIVYLDLPAADLMSAELLTTEREFGPRSLWVRWMLREQAAEAARCPSEPVGRFPACEVEGHHLSMEVGRVELMLVAEDEAWREPGALRELAAEFDLEAIAKL